MINTSLSGRLRNTLLPKSHGLFPLFEAVVNSVQSIDSTYEDQSQGRIEIHIIRSAQGALDLRIPGRLPQEPITEFRIRDNGAGFHKANMTSFAMLDSEYKLRHGGRGVGRLLWLKAFRQVEVKSQFREGHQLKTRCFRFTPSDGIVGQEVKAAESSETFAEIRLVGFDTKYQQSSRKMGLTIARDLLEHCLWYFVREGGAPDIVVFDNDEVINLHVEYEDYMRSSSKVEHVEVGGTRFDIIHLKLKTGAKSAPSLNWCASNRVVVEESISGKVAGLHGSLTDDEGEFIYTGYLTSPFLDEHVRPERTDFDLEETATTTTPIDDSVRIQETLPAEEPSRDEIRNAVLQQVEAYLGDSLASAREKGRGVREQQGPALPAHSPTH